VVIKQFIMTFAFSTLHKKGLLSLILSPTGRDKREGPGGGKSSFNSLLKV
jgi:hypothetical protein